MPYNVLDPTLAQAAPITDAGDPNSVNDFPDAISFENMQDEIALMMGNRSDIQVGGSLNANFLRWINWGYRHVAGIVDVKELWGSVEFTLLAEQPFYAVPSSLAWIKKMALVDDEDYYYTGGIELEQIDIDTYRTLPNSDEIQTDGQALPPRSYFRYGRMIVVWPTPQLDYSAPVDFRVRVQNMTDADHCPILGTEFHESILLAGAMRTARMLGMQQKSMIYQNDFTSTIRPLINTDGEERSAMHMVAQPIHRKIRLFMGE